MKAKFIYIFTNQLFFLIIFITLTNTFQNEIDNSTDNSTDNNFTNKCYAELSREIDNTDSLLEHNKLYPWIIDHMGKGLNDLGDELECLNSLINTTFLIVTINTIEFFFENDTNLLEYLGVKEFSVGVCIMDACNETFHIYFRQFIEMMKNMDKKDDINSDSQTNNINTNNLIDSRVYLENKVINDGENTENTNDIVEFIEDFNFSGKYKYTIIICFLLYILLKIVVGIFRLIILPKGYDKYVAKSLQEEGKLENIDREEQKAFLQRNADEELLLTEDIDYNPFFDLESYFSLKLKIFKFFDFFSDFSILTTKRNRYYNDNGLETIVFMKALAILFIILYGTFYSLVSLPSKDIFNKSFFKSYFLFFYKMSINSFTCWVFLEGAYATYKLMFFIKSEMMESAINNNKIPKIETKLFTIYAKFLLLFIPKISIFFIMYYFFYYKVEDFHSLLNAKRTYTYIINGTFKENITCGGNPLDIFNFNIFSNKYEDYNECYEFTYVYFNIFICSILFMVILYISFCVRNKIFEIFIILINIVLFFVSVVLIKDENVEDEEKYKYYHFVGQKYSTKIFYSLIGFYHLGYILGFMLFHYENNKFKFNNKVNVKNQIRKTIMNTIKENKIFNEENILDEPGGGGDNNDDDSSNIEHNNTNSSLEKVKLTGPNYYPLSFLIYFLFLLNNLTKFTKKVIIWVCVGLLCILSGAFQIYLNAKDTDFNIKLTTFKKIYFLYEKHLFVIIFFILNSVLIVMPKKRGFKNIINSSFIIAIGRAGFTITCLYHFLCYFCFSSFFIKVKFHIPTFILISIGNFLIIFLVCFICNIIFELPIRMLVKKLLRISKKK